MKIIIFKKLVDYLFLYHFNSLLEISYKKSSITSLLKYISHFSYFVIGIILVQIYSLHKRISSFVDLFWWIDKVKFQTFQISPKFTILSSSLVYTTCQNFEMQKKYFVKTNWRILVCLCPSSSFFYLGLWHQRM